MEDERKTSTGRTQEPRIIRIGINGLGVMGRHLIRAILHEEVVEEKQEVDVVAANDLYPADGLLPVLRHDSVYGSFPGKIERYGEYILVNGRRIKMFTETDPSNLHWEDLGVDVVYEATGVWTKKSGAEERVRLLERYLETKAGARKLVYSAPSDLAERTIVMGVNDYSYNGEVIVSNASCTTNCLAPLALALYGEFGQFRGLMNTVHAYTADQRLQDAPHKDLARAFAAGLNIIPTSTGAAKAIGKILPGLEGKLKGMAMRVPLASGSVVDFVVDVDADSRRVNDILRREAEGRLHGVLEYREGPVVSSMVLGSPIPCVVDGMQTAHVDDEEGTLLRVVAFYDNVSGYSHQALRLIALVGGHGRGK